MAGRTQGLHLTLFLLLISFLCNLAPVGGRLYCSRDSGVEPKFKELFSLLDAEALTKELKQAATVLGVDLDDEANTEKNALDTRSESGDSTNPDTETETERETESGEIEAEGDNNEMNPANSLPLTFLNASILMVSELGEYQLPIMSLVSRGEYIISSANEESQIPWNDIYLVQKNYLSINILCSIASHSYAQNFMAKNVPQGLKNRFPKWLNLCKCWDSTPLTAADDVIDKRIKESVLQSDIYSWTSHDASWCYSKVCSSHEKKMCKSTVDPLRPSCVWIPDDVSLVDFKLVTPMLGATQNFTQLLLDVAGFAYPAPIDEDDDIAAFRNALYTAIVSAGAGIDLAASVLPLYAFNLAAGIFIVLSAKSLGSNWLFRYTIAACLGTAVALALFTLYIYRMADTFLKHNMPSIVHSFVVPVAFMSTFFSPTLSPLNFGKAILGQAWQFWRLGALDMWWLGKAFFLSMGVFTMLATWYFDIFNPQHMTGIALINIIKLIGILLMCNGTASIELSSILIILALFFSEIEDYWSRTYMYIVGKYFTPDTTKLTGRRLTMQQFEQEGALHTQRALNELRRHYQSNPQDVRRVNTAPSIESQIARSNMERFIAGNYSGIPESDDIGEEKNVPVKKSFWKSFLWWLISTAFSIAIVLGVLLLVVEYLDSQSDHEEF